MDTPERNNKPSLDAILSEIQHGNLSKIQLAKAFRRACALVTKEHGKQLSGVNYLSRKLGMNRDKIAETMKILTLSPPIQQLIEEGKVPASAISILIKERKKYGEKLDGDTLAKLIQEQPNSVEGIRLAVKKTLEETGVYDRSSHPYQHYQVAKQFKNAYGGLLGEALIIVDPLDPEYEDLCTHVDLGDDEVVVILINRKTAARVTKVLKEALIPYRE